MTASPQKKPAPTRVTHFNNWISAAGAVLTVGALFSFALLVAMDFSAGEKNPYLGILTYIVAPLFLIAGLSLVLFGWWQQRRHRRLHTGAKTNFWAIDWDNPNHRRGLVVFTLGGAAFLLLSAFGSYQTYHYAESNVFCGQVCHSAMNAEFQTYQRGAHARVACVECHVGSGTKAFVQAKLNGTRQLYSFILDNYARPIPTPVHNLRPAQDTCEKCHWPEKFLGNLDMSWEHFLSDRKNTPYTVRMLMRVNNGRPGSPLNGIHWHVSQDQIVEYYAADEKLQDIVWMRVLNKKDGSSKVFRNETFKGEPPANRIRVMDCIDCHNRPAHVFPPANDSVEQAMALGKINRELPNIKRHAVAAMIQEGITTTAEAPGKIAEYLKNRYKDAPGLTETIAEVQRIYAITMFPERKADWRQYPNNIGHKDWPGCFRCHDDKHSTATGEKVRASDCTSCHIIISQGKGDDLATLTASGLQFKHPAGDYDAELRCADCHNGGIQGK